MMTLEQARRLMNDPHANRKVRYEPYEGKVEYGVIIRVTDQCVFVRYSDSLQAKATAPEQLTVVTE